MNFCLEIGTYSHWQVANSKTTVIDGFSDTHLFGKLWKDTHHGQPKLYFTVFVDASSTPDWNFGPGRCGVFQHVQPGSLRGAVVGTKLTTSRADSWNEVPTRKE